LPPEQAIGILDDDRICQRRTQNAYSNDARRRIVPMNKEIPPDRRLSSLHEQKASGGVCRLPASRVGISRVRQVLPGHKCGTVIGSTCRRFSYSTMWERCFLIGGVSIFGGSAITPHCVLTPMYHFLANPIVLVQRRQHPLYIRNFSYVSNSCVRSCGRCVQRSMHRC